jgi:predicted NBD/HSP70 family sugar kinase
VPADLTSAAAEAPRARGTGTTAYLRELNYRTVYDELVRAAQSRRQLVASTGLSKPTVSGALAHLQRSGLIRPSGDYASGRAGPAAELFELDPGAGFVVGVQVDGRIQVAVADLNGVVLARGKVRNRSRAGSGLAAAVKTLATRTVERVGRALSDAAVAVVATPGVPHEPTRSVQRTNLAGAGQPGFLDDLAAALGVPCLVDNDINLAAVAEYRLGAAQGVPDFALISLEPGLGLSAFVGGEPHRGVHGAAGEIALLPVIADRSLDSLVRSANRTPGEELLLAEAASASGVVRLAHRLGLAEVRTARDVRRAADAGDRVADRVIRAHLQQLALAVAAAAAILDPALIVVSGAVDDRVIAHVRDALKAVNTLTPDLVADRLGEEAVLLGTVAAALGPARDRVFARAQQG